jgi:hypothetical protein
LPRCTGLEDGGSTDETAVASRMADYVIALREHMAIEERDLFPRARQVLDEDDLAEIDRAFRRVTDPIFDASLRDAYVAYPPVVRYLVERPALERALDVLDCFYESAFTLGEVLFGAGRAPSVQQRPPAIGSKRPTRTA